MIITTRTPLSCTKTTDALNSLFQNRGLGLGRGIIPRLTNACIIRDTSVKPSSYPKIKLIVSTLVSFTMMLSSQIPSKLMVSSKMPSTLMAFTNAPSNAMASWQAAPSNLMAAAQMQTKVIIPSENDSNVMTASEIPTNVITTSEIPSGVMDHRKAASEVKVKEEIPRICWRWQSYSNTVKK